MLRCLIHVFRHAGPLALALLLGPLALPVHAQTPTLQINYANAGTTSAVVANCLAGVNLYGDTRSCSGSTDAVPALAGAVLTGDGHAAFPGHGVDTEAWARAAFGTLGAFAQTTTQNVDAFYNAQSRGAAEMTDFIAATNTSGAALTTYAYTITVHGSLSAPVGCGGTIPCAYGSVFVGFNTSPLGYCPSCVNAINNWTSESGKTPDTVYTGTFTMAAGMSFEMRASVDVSSYVNVFAGQSATAFADYGNAVTVQLTGVTPGANTVGKSGYDYALAVPEPSSTVLMLLGLAAVGLSRRRAFRRG